MRVRLINQPRRHQLGDTIRAQLRSADTFRFWAASAWVRRPALRQIDAELRAFSARVKAADCRGLFGVDLGGTTVEGLETAADLFRQARVFHSSGVPQRTFHPKFYLFEKEKSGFLAIGSSNLTPGGLWGNFEADVVFELDLTDDADSAFAAEARDWFEQSWSDREGTLPIGPRTIRALEADPTIWLPREHEVRTVLRSATRGSAMGARRAFPSPVRGLKTIPKAPSDVEEQEQPTVAVPGLPLEEIATPDREDDLRVIIAGIPRERWGQVGFNRQVAEDFFRVYANGDVLWLQGVQQSGRRLPAREGRLIYPETSNQNHRIEFPEPDGRGDPRPDRPLLVILERSFRTFQYVSLRPGDRGYVEMGRELQARESYGVSRSPDTKRVLMTYGELKAAWPGRPHLRR